MKNKMRTCTEICIDALNNQDDPDYLFNLWKEVVETKYERPLVELQYMQELTHDRAKKLLRDFVEDANELL